MRLEGGSKSSKGGIPQLSQAWEAERCRCPRGAKRGSKFEVLSLVYFLSAWLCTCSGSDSRTGGVTPGRRKFWVRFQPVQLVVVQGLEPARSRSQSLIPGGATRGSPGPTCGLTRRASRVPATIKVNYVCLCIL
ncbi:hypothetical protein MC885_012080 [Smutsia gigantea]|nr:hypothetical protein MC885_012080 [Smutsia gigantea]